MFYCMFYFTCDRSLRLGLGPVRQCKSFVGPICWFALTRPMRPMRYFVGPVRSPSAILTLSLFLLFLFSVFLLLGLSDFQFPKTLSACNRS